MPGARNETPHTGTPGTVTPVTVAPAPVVLALLVGVVLVIGSVLVGLHLRAEGARLYLGGPLLAGSWDPRLPVAVWLPVLVAVTVLALAPHADLLGFGRLLSVAAVATAAWAVSLALVDGPGGLTRGLDSVHDYLADVPRVTALRDLLPGYVDRVPAGSADAWTTHVGGHPPGTLFLFTVLDRLGLSGSGPAAVLCIAAGACAVPAVLLTLRAVADETLARAAAPFLVLSPAAIWLATSADALFLGISAWGIAGLALAAAAAPGLRADLLALSGGVLLGGSLFLSYGLVLLAPLAISVIAVQRRWRVLVIGGLGVAAVVAVAALAGFWWLAGLEATSGRVREGAAANRPGLLFVFANLAAAAIALGPAGVAGLGALLSRAGRRTAVAVPALAVLAAVLIADLSQLSKGEVERIYLPFHFWLLTATVLLGPRGRTRWLLAQVLAALAVQLLIRTSW
ncbi:MAG: hypothetical protein H0T85_10590 [Geodermatophilaceae bacterium]|nr:hypothetical protein [Geodermatophilaceae bacterium]